MKFKCVKDELLKHLSLNQRTVSIRSIVPELQGILFKVKDKNLTLQSTDQELSFFTNLGVDAEMDGSCILPARYIFEIVKNLTSKNSEFELKENQINIKNNTTSYSLNIIPGDSFPNIVPDDLSEIAVMDGKILNEAVGYVYKSTARDESRPVLTGVFIDFKKNDLELASTDSFRLSVYKTKQKNKNEISLIVPSRALDELTKTVTLFNEPKVVIETNNSYIVFNVGDVKLISRLIDGVYPDYKQLLPDKFNITIEFSKTEILDALKRVQIVSGSNPIKLNIIKNKLEIEGYSQGIGKASEKVNIKYDGKSITAAFNGIYLIEGIQNISDENFLFNINDPSKPALINSEKDKNYSYIVMPVRLSD